MEASGNSTRKRTRESPAMSEAEKEDEAQLRALQRRLASVRSTKQLLREQLDRLNTEATKLELIERKSRQQVNAQATKLTRMQQLQDDAARRREEAEARRIEQEQARTQRAEEERARRERAVDATPYGDDADLATLADFLADDSALL